MNEATIMKEIQIAVSKLGHRVFRNNSGKLKNDRGQYVHYGLGNGTSDLIGWTTVTITPEMVGKKVAIFTAVEVKTEKGKVSDDQDTFIWRVNIAGGIAFVARSSDDAVHKIKSRCV